MRQTLPDSTPITPSDRPHWLVRRNTIRGLWAASLVLLGVLVAADLLVLDLAHAPAGGASDGAMTISHSFGFYAWYGFVTCAAMVLFAKILGLAVKRPDTYYEDAGPPAAVEEGVRKATHGHEA